MSPLISTRTEQTLAVGQIIPVGIDQPQWMYVTRIGVDHVMGPVWVFRQEKWSDKPVIYATESIFRRVPVNAPKPKSHPCAQTARQR
jgi:hypothetical protein